ncbi:MULTISPECIES: hypothetical protein [unclassified Wenzhouxiangella]|uniref:hypothetical protein n=1 Tax=unclassified Wenzhouxiangella TaxID=2613841 RepID=UPI000E329A90|nr:MULTISPECIES: hypothetical protein [unclassified Wenzhouxiangella]RFF28294.1 hypothetical protein DZK25_03340 [Wenzhouxiangella sp. 15181]RFP67781.1 hypothetical protein DZK26_11295 [Wenzhouxiangella sp. 15190]
MPIGSFSRRTSDSYHNQFLSCCLLALALIGTWLCYQPGLNAALHFDDTPNLSRLQNVDGAESALRFITGGNAGPLGRPLSLATFLPEKHAWPNKTSTFLRTNVLLHLINGLLVAWFAFRILIAGNASKHTAAYGAALTASLWVLLPILASTSLLIIQRMTSLSATFVLLGLVCHILLRSRITARPGLFLAPMAISLGIFTTLAALSKENGALLPTLVLVLEWTLLAAPQSIARKTWHRWCAVFLWVPTLVIAVKLLSMVPYSDDLVAMRGFGGWERLITQSRILWEYLFHAFIPIDTLDLGPFHDTYEPSRSLFEPLSLLATAAWLTLLGLALICRRKVPVFSFAVLWFIVGHSVESSVASLDLYFEHRNYVPLIGPCLALAWAAVHFTRSRPLFTSGAMTAYIGLLATTLWVVTSMWGQPLREAQEQHLANPMSSRAVGHFGGQLLAVNAVGPTILLLDQAIENGVASERLKTTKLYLTCAYHPDSESEIPNELRFELRTANYDRNLAHALYILTRTRVGQNCGAVEIEDIKEMLFALEENATFSGHAETRYWIHRARERLASHDGDRAERKQQLLNAQKQRFDPFTIELWTRLQLVDGLAQKACRRLQVLWMEAPLNPTRRINRWLVLKDQARHIAHESGLDCTLR